MHQLNLEEDKTEYFREKLGNDNALLFKEVPHFRFCKSSIYIFES